MLMYNLYCILTSLHACMHAKCMPHPCLNIGPGITLPLQDAGHVSATNAKVVAAASKGHLSVHDVIIKTAELVPLAKVRACMGT